MLRQRAVRCAQQAAGQLVVGGDGVLAVAADELAVDDHGVDAVRLGHQAVGAGRQVVDALQRAGADGLGIEHHDVGRPALGQHAAVGDAEHLGRPLREVVHGLLDGEGLALAHPVAEQVGRVAGVAELAGMGAGVATAR